MNQLGLFAKFWQPGAVKTRLAASVGTEAACKLYRAFVFHLLSRHRDCGDTRTVVFSPCEKESEFRKAIPDSWNLTPQSSGDLGERMKAFFESQFELKQNIPGRDDQEPDKILIIGADCPRLENSRIEESFALLDRVSVVLGPCNDGGYYLLAVRDKCPNIFSGIPWSTSSVFERTIQQLEQQGINYHTLDPLTDVDELENLFDLQSDLESLQVRQNLDQLDLDLLGRIREVTRNHRRPSETRSVESD